MGQPGACLRGTALGGCIGRCEVAAGRGLRPRRCTRAGDWVPDCPARRGCITHVSRGRAGSCSAPLRPDAAWGNHCQHVAGDAVAECVDAAALPGARQRARADKQPQRLGRVWRVAKVAPAHAPKDCAAVTCAAMHFAGCLLLGMAKLLVKQQILMMLFKAPTNGIFFPDRRCFICVRW